MKNYYEILEVSPKASKEIIESTYRILEKKYQPDQYVGQKRIEVENKLRDISEAYKILTDNFLREQYDAELEKEHANHVNSYINAEIQRPKRERKTIKRERQKTREDEIIREQKTPQVGSFGAIVNIVKNLFRKRDREKFDVKNIKREDYIAAGLTVVIMIVLGIILWFIPFTNGFIRSLIPF